MKIVIVRNKINRLINICQNYQRTIEGQCHLKENDHLPMKISFLTSADFILFHLISLHLMDLDGLDGLVFKMPRHWLLLNFSFTLFHFISLHLMESVGTVVASRDGKSNLVLGGNKKETDRPPTCLMEE